MAKLSEIQVLLWTNDCAAKSISHQYFFKSHDFEKIYVSVPRGYQWDAGQVLTILKSVGFTEVSHIGSRAKVFKIDNEESGWDKFYHKWIDSSYKRGQFDFTITLRASADVTVNDLETTKKKLTVTKGMLKEFAEL